MFDDWTKENIERQYDRERECVRVCQNMTTELDLDIVKRLMRGQRNDRKRKRSQMVYVWYRS